MTHLTIRRLPLEPDRWITRLLHGALERENVLSTLAGLTTQGGAFG